ncbi:MAG TPA: maleylpyruvate isomerase family mycothiol-dependent enzyme [Streptosporangiaceae bacterium]|jgi:uncharacterized protein (TIGR03083 family)|nr:maleylpyruvate isomerase family mycothiol-dependent enzyme [Streptosporangiaceae bacterium]
MSRETQQMSDAIEAVRADRAALLEICGTFTEADWQTASGCEGWTVKDLVAHLAGTFWALVDPAQLPDIAGLSLEAGMEAVVQARRGVSPQAALADYAEASERGLAQLPQFAALDLEVPLADAGTYPAPLLASAYAFDHFTHIRADLFQPRGPLTSVAPEVDALRVEPTLDWIEAALPQQNPAAAEAGQFELQVTGPGGRIIMFGDGQAVATISSDAGSFVRWVTQRGSWEDLGVLATGDEPALSAARKLKVV